ncbi:hypothetical protein [Stenotrophomonas indicatrix]|uniref:hypothetical protein n=1 Tax=Stenotrophomonas indicatrix TaxID=2045451 RepID=UPI0028A08651|nr:hypothetical protein [Stenotrophomonas indicatrix]
MERAFRLLVAMAISACCALYAGDARADWNVIDCTGCPEWQMRDTAMYAGDGPHAVFDAANGVVKYYQVNGWNDSPIEFGQEPEVIEWAPPPGASQWAGVMREYYQVYGTPLAMSSEIHINDVRPNYPDLYGQTLTAYDVASDINLKAGIAARVENSLTANAAAQSVLNRFTDMVQNLFGGNAPVNMTVKLRLDDGSSVEFKKDSVSSSYYYVRGSARFSNGSVVPELGARDKSEYTGQWVFNSSVSLDDFWAAMNDIGATLHNVGGGSEMTIIVCYWRPTEGELHCTRQL